MDKQIKCKACQCDKFYIRTSGPHIGIYCKVCGKWNKWVSDSELNHLKQLGVIDNMIF